MFCSRRKEGGPPLFLQKAVLPLSIGILSIPAYCKEHNEQTVWKDMYLEKSYSVMITRVKIRVYVYLKVHL